MTSVVACDQRIAFAVSSMSMKGATTWKRGDDHHGENARRFEKIAWPQ
jgi:hypothetical protein